MSDYEKVYDFENLYRAFLHARRGKREKTSVAKFEANLLEAIHLLSALLGTKRYRLSEYYTFKVFEPKERVVMSNSFKDKVVQHSLCDNVIEPAIIKSFIKDNYASQRDKGPTYGLDRLEFFMRRYFFSRKARAEQERRAAGLPPIPVQEGGYAEGWVLKCDIGKYFYSIRHEILFQKVGKYVTDPDVLWLLALILDSTEDPGIPIGNQTSQWFAILYLNDLDHFIKEKLGIKFYARYMDDFALIHESKEYLQYCRAEIEKHVGALGLYLNAKTNIFPLRNGIDFLGFHTYLTDTGKVIRKLRRKSKNNVKRKLKKMKKRLEAGEITIQNVRQSYQSWRGHAGKGDCYHLIHDMDRFYKNLFGEEQQCRKN